MANKPITVARQEFMQTLVDTANKSGLPAFVMAEVLGQMTEQMKQLAWQQYQHDASEYEKAKAEEDAKKEE